MPRFSLALAFLLVPLAALGAPTNAVSVHKPWFRYLLAQIPAALYLTLDNAGDQPEVLTGASSPACGMLMLHRSIQSGGMAEMVMVKSVTVPAHGSFAFTPDAYHIMCMQPAMKLGQSVPVTLDFADGTSVSLTAPVYGASNQP